MKFITTIIITLFIKCTFSQNEKLYIPIEVLNTYNIKTRNINGKPGINYFQNFADYKIKVKVNPYKYTITGNETIQYKNNSFDTLSYIVFDLHQNLFTKGQKRSKNINKNDIGKSIFIDSVFVEGKLIDKDMFVKFWGTKMKIKLKQDILPKENIKLRINWHYTIATETKIRTGVYENNSMFIGYWYPQISVYDDIDGWDMSSYDGFHEFYSEFSNYYVEIELPENFIVWATGELQNPKNVLSDKIYKKYSNAIKSNKITQVITIQDIKNSKLTKPKQNTWIFKADSVSDFAFGLSNKYCWDITTIKLKTGNNVVVNTAYNPNSKDYNKSINISRDVINDFSNSSVQAYPFPQVSMFNGAGAMEFPMITNIGTEPDLNGILFTISHEYMHNYFPFLVGTNQKKYAWIDEGLATYLTTSTQKKLSVNFNPLINHIKVYESYAGKEQDEILMTSSHFLDNRSYVINSYFKACSAFHVLHELIGEEEFSMCIQDFIKNWQYKHPLPYDLFNTFNRVSGEDLNWFWNKWFFQKGYPDLAIDTLIISDSKIKIQIKNIGGYPVAINLKSYSKNKVLNNIYIGTIVWKNQDLYTIEIDYNSAIDKIQIGDELIPDINKKNNLYFINSNNF